MRRDFMVGSSVSMFAVFGCYGVKFMNSKNITSTFSVENRDFTGFTDSIEEAAKAGKF